MQLHAAGEPLVERRLQSVVVVVGIRGQTGYAANREIGIGKRTIGSKELRSIRLNYWDAVFIALKRPIWYPFDPT